MKNHIILIIFNAALCLWTITSTEGESLMYIVSILLLMVSLFVAKKYTSKEVCAGIYIASALISIGLSINYCAGSDSRYALPATIIWYAAVFTAVYLTIERTDVYRNKKVLNYATLALPLIVLATLVFGIEVNGVKMYLFGVLTFAWILMLFPFVAAKFMAEDENCYAGKGVDSISINMTKFLIYMFILYAGCMLMGEMSLLLILGSTASILFLIRCKSIKSKVVYSVLSVLGAVIAGSAKRYIAERISVWIDPSGASDETVAAEPVLYLFRHFKEMGFYGKGIENLPYSYYPNRYSDYSLTLLINDYGVLIGIIVLILALMLIYWMIKGTKLASYEKYLNLTSVLIIASIVFLNTASNLGSFITAGVPFPFVSIGLSVNTLLIALIAIHAALKKKVEVSKND